MIACTGGTSQPAVIRNNDLPGIVSAAAAQRLIRHYGVRPGLRAVVLTAGDEGYAAALDLAEHGADVAAVGPAVERRERVVFEGRPALGNVEAAVARETLEQGVFERDRPPSGLPRADVAQAALSVLVRPRPAPAKLYAPATSRQGTAVPRGNFAIWPGRPRVVRCARGLGGHRAGQRRA